MLAFRAVEEVGATLNAALVSRVMTFSLGVIVERLGGVSTGHRHGSANSVSASRQTYSPALADVDPQGAAEQSRQQRKQTGQTWRERAHCDLMGASLAYETVRDFSKAMGREMVHHRRRSTILDRMDRYDHE